MNTSQQYWEHPELRWQHFDEEYGFVVWDTKLDKKWGMNKDFSHPSELSAQLNAMEQALTAERDLLALTRNALHEAQTRVDAERERAEDYKRHTERLDKEYRDVLAELQAEQERANFWHGMHEARMVQLDNLRRELTSE